MKAADSAPLIAVIGSVNMDLVATTAHIPSPGQTVLADDFRTVPGGKGANQAVAIARLGGNVAIIGRIGADSFGASLRDGLIADGVDCAHLKQSPEAPTGIAMITVSHSGENCICVAPGANRSLTPKDINAAAGTIARAKVCVLQLEIPLETAIQAIRLARQHKVQVILDPAPAPASPPDELFAVDILTPNQSEAAELIGERNRGLDARQIAARLKQRGAKMVVLKCGAAGAYGSDENDYSIAAPPITVVDSTGAGDAFTGALAVAHAQGLSTPDAVRFAVAAGSLACTRFGAQPSMPRFDEVHGLLQASWPLQ